MHFRGGGIGHKVTHEWDEFLQHKGHEAPLDDEDVGNNLKSEDLEGKLAQDELEVGDDGTDGEGEEPVNSESDESEGEEDDGIVADKGEELNEDIWAWEGYSALWFDFGHGCICLSHDIHKKPISFIIRTWTTTSDYDIKIYQECAEA